MMRWLGVGCVSTHLLLLGVCCTHLLLLATTACLKKMWQSQVWVITGAFIFQFQQTLFLQIQISAFLSVWIEWINVLAARMKWWID